MAHAQYLTYDEYKAYGGALAPAAYPPMELKSRKRIDYLTDSRVQNMQTVPDAVKLCAFALIALEEAVGVEAQATNPAALLRNPAQKPAAFDDFLKLRDKIDELQADISKTY